MSIAELPHVEPRSRREWRAWLRRNHAKVPRIWLVLAKKSSGLPSLTYAEAVEEALCHGWIDGLAHPVDERRWRQLFGPRKPGSGWSRLNKQRIARLDAQGALAAAGRAVIDAAKADGSWSKLDAVEAYVVPPDLAKAFRRHRGSAAKFAAFNASARKGILGWISEAKRPQTRAQRVQKTASMAARGLRARYDEG